jgi:hypothetical protein
MGPKRRRLIAIYDNGFIMWHCFRRTVQPSAPEMLVLSATLYGAIVLS